MTDQELHAQFASAALTALLTHITNVRDETQEAVVTTAWEYADLMLDEMLFRYHTNQQGKVE